MPSYSQNKKASIDSAKQKQKRAVPPSFLEKGFIFLQSVPAHETAKREPLNGFSHSGGFLSNIPLYKESRYRFARLLTKPYICSSPVIGRRCMLF